MEERGNSGLLQRILGALKIAEARDKRCHEPPPVLTHHHG
jgi:hypothetical protein